MTPELIRMFEEAGPSWDPPTPEILERHGFLHTITWVQRCIDRRNRPKRPSEDAEIAIRKALVVCRSTFRNSSMQVECWPGPVSLCPASSVGTS